MTDIKNDNLAKHKVYNDAVRKMAAIIREAGTLPELECFDTGDLVLAQALASVHWLAHLWAVLARSPAQLLAQ